MHKEKDDIIHTQCSCMDNLKNIWIYSSDINALFKFDCSDKKIEYISSNVQYKWDSKELYNEAFCYNNYIYLTPVMAKGLGVYSIEEKKFEEIQLLERGIAEYYTHFFIDDNTVILFPLSFGQYYYQVDLDGNSVERKKFIFDFDETRYLGKITRGCFGNEKFLFSLNSVGEYFEFDYFSSEVRIIPLNIKKKIKVVNNREGHLFILTDDNSFYLIDGADVLKCLLYKSNEREYCRVVSLDKWNVVVPYALAPILLYEHDNLQYEIDLNWQIICYERRKETFTYVDFYIINGNLIALPYLSEYGFVYSLINKKIEYFKMIAPNNVIEKILLLYGKRAIPDMVDEDKYLTLDNWIKLIMSLSEKGSVYDK